MWLNLFFWGGELATISGLAKFWGLATIGGVPQRGTATGRHLENQKNHDIFAVVWPISVKCDAEMHIGSLNIYYSRREFSIYVFLLHITGICTASNVIFYVDKVRRR